MTSGLWSFPPVGRPAGLRGAVGAVPYVCFCGLLIRSGLWRSRMFQNRRACRPPVPIAAMSLSWVKSEFPMVLEV
eukprot:9470802-Pyramimonas_sp.AAC.1